jgi:hypothetical protein
MGPCEGPFPSAGVPLVRLGFGPMTRLHLPDRGAGRWELRLAAKAMLTPQRVTVRLDDEPIFKYDFARHEPFEPLTIPLNLSAVPHDLTIEYLRWDGDDPAKPAAVAFKTLQILPADSRETSTHFGYNPR